MQGDLGVLRAGNDCHETNGPYTVTYIPVLRLTIDKILPSKHTPILMCTKLFSSHHKNLQSMLEMAKVAQSSKTDHLTHITKLSITKKNGL